MDKFKDLLGSAVADMSVVCWQIQNFYETALQGLGAKAHVLALPPEILSIIFKEIGDDTASIKNVMLACRKFRDVAIAEPALWCTICNTDTAAHWKRCLERSSGCDLIIRIVRPDVDKYQKLSWLQKEFCHLISMECGRWRELYIELDASADSRFSSHGFFKKLHLPRLSLLSVVYKVYTGHPLIINGMIQSWTVPNLKRFQGLPLEGLTKFADSVISCEFILEDILIRSMPTILQTLLPKIRGCRNLKLMFFREGGSNEGPQGAMFPTVDHTLILPDLQSLWLTFSPSRSESTLAMDQLLTNTILTARIAELTLEIYEKDKFAFDRYPRQTICSVAAREFSQVRILRLIMGHITNFKYPFISNQMHKLEHLIICLFDTGEPTERFSDILTSGSLPSGLKTVTFRDCAKLAHDYLIDMGQTLASNETFEKLEIVNCPLSTDTQRGLTILLQDRFSQAYCVPKKTPCINLYQKRIIRERKQRTSH